ncbi:hypothetical protein LPTSP3_g18880 [Leptospira kobayashii]|uniref:DUF5777 domain-containing protein n=1 Tax=Leptospira kobayashii TaxID=1917830 RepID=A0ABM7URN6_9LEPT|nr:DUF5777 family beta-barrel protein [Leptospira kobayashii]BDA78958.1 hypothetical protein LPTSP3_g18880 [Leptospira kobayashii]
MTYFKIFKFNCLSVVSSFLLVFSFPGFADPVPQTHFMGTSLIYMPSTEDIGAKNLVFRFNHRFGSAKPGSDNFLGLDEGANTQLSLDYGITDRWSVGIARTSQFKTYEARTKFRLVSQDWFPFTVSLFGVAGQETSDQSLIFSYYTRSWTGNSTLDNRINGGLNTYELTDQDKRSYMGSLLISRKFTDRISIQASPMYTHRNFAPYNISNSRTGLSIGGRFKITSRVDISFESILTPKRDYFGDNYSVESQKTTIDGITQLTGDQINRGLTTGSVSMNEIILKNLILDKSVEHRFVPLGMGVDIETGGHVFQFFVSNTRALAHTQLLRGADYDYNKKEFSLGFNILRQFSLGEEKEKENW